MTVEVSCGDVGADTPVPTWLLCALRPTTRSTLVHQHSRPIPLQRWWNQQIVDSGLPGGPLLTRTLPDGRPGLDRGTIFELAEPLGCPQSASDDLVLTFLWHVLAWSTQKKAVAHQRVSHVTANVRTVLSTLRCALTLAFSDPAGAYGTLLPLGESTRAVTHSRRPAIAGFGPTLSTKLLYFVGAGTSTHPCAILDGRVAAELRRSRQWPTLGADRWHPTTYQRYVDLLGSWAEVAGPKLNREVGRDELERLLHHRQ